MAKLKSGISITRCPTCKREVVSKNGVLQAHADMLHGGYCKEPSAAKATDHALPEPIEVGDGANEEYQDLLRKLGELDKIKPRPLAKLYGSAGPTPQQKAEWEDRTRVWNRETSAIRRKLPALLEKSNAEFRARQTGKATDHARMHRALDAAMDRRASARDAALSVGQRVVIQEGFGGKGGMAGQDFKRWSKDTPAVVTDLASGGGSVYVRPDGDPYKWKVPERALHRALDAAMDAALNRAQARDAARAPAKYMHEAVNLYYLARTALSGKDDGRWARLNWAATEMHKAHPETSATAFYMSLSDDWLR